MAKDKFPVTPAIRFLRERKVVFTEHLYAYEERGGTAVSARELGVDEHTVIKTLIMEDDTGRPLVILMHGDREVSTKDLARTLGVRAIRPCSPAAANRHTGYLVGGTSPFGTKKPLPVCMEKSILAQEKIYLNGGKRGFLVGLAPGDVQTLLKPTLVEVGITKG
jgi:Cys-tRNA(Pro) deacylase